MSDNSSDSGIVVAPKPTAERRMVPTMFAKNREEADATNKAEVVPPKPIKAKKWPRFFPLDPYIVAMICLGFALVLTSDSGSSRLGQGKATPQITSPIVTPDINDESESNLVSLIREMEMQISRIEKAQEKTWLSDSLKYQRQVKESLAKTRDGFKYQVYYGEKKFPWDPLSLEGLIYGHDLREEHIGPKRIAQQRR